MVDTHVHLLDRRFSRDRGQVIERAFQAGNQFLIEVATDLRASENAVKLAHVFEGVYAAIGVHPHDARTFDDRARATLEELACRPGVVAIGETGLDFYRDLSPREVQKRVFAEQIALARQKGLPLIVHVRNAYREALEIIEKERGSEVGGVLHCFSGDADSAEKAIRMGFFLGFGGTVTYEGSGSSKLVTTVPLESIILETDCPYRAPEPYRKERNEPAYVGIVLDRVAELRNVSREKVDEVTSLNANVLFRIGSVDASRHSGMMDKGTANEHR